MTDNTNTNQQQTTDATPAGTGAEKLFTQADLDRIIGERLSRVKGAAADDETYKAKYEAVQKELEGMKAAQLHQQKEAAYRDLLAKASISEKRIATVLRCSDVDALELDETGKAVGADKLVEAIKTEWADFVVTTVIKGADVPHPPVNYGGGSDQIADAFKPKI